MISYKRIVFVLVIIFLFSGCGTVPLRSPNEDVLNIEAKYKSTLLGIKDIILFEIDSEFDRCRLFKLDTPEGSLNIKNYLREMLNKKLFINGLYSRDNQKQLSIVVTEFNFNSQIFFGKWYIKSKVKIKDKEIQINKQLDFSTNFFGDIACHQVAEKLPVFLNQYLEAIVNNPDIQSMLK